MVTTAFPTDLDIARRADLKPLPDVAAEMGLPERFLERSRGRKTAYLAARVRTLSAEDRAVLARAAILLEQLLEGEE